MVDLFDDLVNEAKKQKKDFLKTVKVMYDIKKQGAGASFNNRFKAIGDVGKFRFIAPPIRDGSLGDRPKYVAQVADITDVDHGDMPVTFIMTMYHVQQIYGALIDTNILRDPLKDKKLKISVGTVWQVDAIESSFSGEERRKNFMLNFTILPDESTIDAEALVEEIKAPVSEPEEEKLNLGIA